MKAPRSNAEQCRLYRQRYPEKVKERQRKEKQSGLYRIRARVHKAVESGSLIKPSACSSCRAVLPKAKIEAHHHDYSKPLDVVWLCRSCHVALHRAAA